MLEKEVEKIKELVGEGLVQSYYSPQYNAIVRNMKGAAGVAAGCGFFVG